MGFCVGRLQYQTCSHRSTENQNALLKSIANDIISDKD